jgi:hypothetical protein
MKPIYVLKQESLDELLEEGLQRDKKKKEEEKFASKIGATKENEGVAPTVPTTSSVQVKREMVPMDINKGRHKSTPGDPLMNKFKLV